MPDARSQSAFPLKKSGEKAAERATRIQRNVDRRWIYVNGYIDRECPILAKWPPLRALRVQVKRISQLWVEESRMLGRAQKCGRDRRTALWCSSPGGRRPRYRNKLLERIAEKEKSWYAFPFVRFPRMGNITMKSGVISELGGTGEDIEGGGFFLLQTAITH